MSGSYTNGPWQLRRDERRDEYAVQIKEKGFSKEIATIATGFDEPWDSQQHANARLIAAAPELCHALRMIVSALPKNLDWLDPDVERLAKHAIARATGETP